MGGESFADFELDPDEPTWVAVLTPSGRGAVASIVVAGPAAVDRVASRVVLNRADGLMAAPRRILVGRWEFVDGEEIVVCRHDERRVEIHCHGGPAAASRIVEGLVAAGCLQVAWLDWIERSSQNRFAAAAASQLPYARTERTASILLDQFRGALRKELELLEALLIAGDITAAVGRLDLLLDRAAIGRHLIEPWRVVIAGPPNAGKSTLLNAIVGFQRAIVFDQPGTTRDVVTAATVLDGWPIELADTAGLRETSDELELAGIERAQVQMRSADLVILLFDASVPLSDDHRRLLDAWDGAVRTLNKIDLVNQPADVEAGSFYVSARTGKGVEELMNAIVGRLVPNAPPPGAGVPLNVDQVDVISEIRSPCLADDPGVALDRVRAVLAQPS